MFPYSALIRTFNSEATLPATLTHLARQTCPPSRFVFVDSGSTDRTLAALPANSTVHRYVGREFNYSSALNQGVQLVQTPFTLIISSHTRLLQPRALEYALGVLGIDEGIGAAYFCHDPAPSPCHRIIDASSFNGFNGVWNTCALIRTELLRERPFRPDVFASEDAEWSQWLLNERRRYIARISGGDMVNRNARSHENSAAKRLNEYVSIAYFVNRRMMGPVGLAAVALKAINPWRTPAEGGRRFWAVLLGRLACCHFRKPRYSSRYF